MDRTEPRGSQSKLPSILIAAVLVAVVIRLVTAWTGREKTETGGGLVAWTPLAGASASARASNKRVLYDFTAAWCAPCHLLDKEGWGDGKIAALVNGSYVAVRVTDRAREDGKNTAAIDELQRRYQVSGFPTLVVADADGREIAKEAGYRGREGLVRFLEGSAGRRP